MTDTIDTNEEGNTITSSINSKSRKWCFTLNNWTIDEFDTMTQTFVSKGWSFIMGKEIGVKNKVPHIQGYVDHKNAIRFDTLKKLMPRANLRSALGSRKDNYKYCSKDGDFTTNIDLISFRDKLKNEVLLEYKDVQWKPWQLDILNILKEKPDKRKIYWFWEPIGNVGKSWLVMYLAITRNVILADGKKHDIFNQINTSIENKQKPEIILLDIPRSNLNFVNYGAIEQMKGGLIYSGKYEGSTCIYPRPHVILMANEPPRENEYSPDRWDIREI